MARKPNPANPPCPHCGHPHTVRNGHCQDQQRWLCRSCHRSFGPTTGTPLYRLRNPPEEVARALLAVLRRGSLNAAEEQTGHKYETIGRWLKATAHHAEVLTEALVHDLHLSQVEIDEFWSFVRKKGGLLLGKASVGVA